MQDSVDDLVGPETFSDKYACDRFMIRSPLGWPAAIHAELKFAERAID